MQHSATHPTAALPCTPPPRAHTRCAEGCGEGETAYRETAEPATPLPRTLQVGVAPLAPGSVAVSAAEAGFWSSATAKFLWILDGAPEQCSGLAGSSRVLERLTHASESQASSSSPTPTARRAAASRETPRCCPRAGRASWTLSSRRGWCGWTWTERHARSTRVSKVASERRLGGAHVLLGASLFN